MKFLANMYEILLKRFSRRGYISKIVKNAEKGILIILFSSFFLFFPRATGWKGKSETRPDFVRRCVVTKTHRLEIRGSVKETFRNKLNCAYQHARSETDVLKAFQSNEDRIILTIDNIEISTTGVFAFEIKKIRHYTIVQTSQNTNINYGA